MFVVLITVTTCSVEAQPKFRATFPKTLHMLDAKFPLQLKAGWGDTTFRVLPLDFILVKTVPQILDDTAWRTSDKSLTYELHWSGLPLGADSLTIPVVLTDPTSRQTVVRHVLVYGRKFPRRLR